MWTVRGSERASVYGFTFEPQPSRDEMLIVPPSI